MRKLADFLAGRDWLRRKIKGDPDLETESGRVLAPPSEENPVVGSCPKCGIELRRVMWYSCHERGCPSGLGSRFTL